MKSVQNNKHRDIVNMVRLVKSRQYDQLLRSSQQNDLEALTFD